MNILKELSPITAIMTIFQLLVVFLVLYKRIFSRGALPIAYNVGVIGFPKSGKTTLITSMFGELFSNKILASTIVPRGSETIERVNADLERLAIGKALGPTKDQDLFAYRIDILRRSTLFPRKYKVEIGDFPGEDSQLFYEQFGDWLHHTPYFKWVMEADAFIFIIDIASFLADTETGDYKATMTKAIRASWQHLLEYHIEGNKELRLKPVVLAFTKADLLFALDEDISDTRKNDDLHHKIMALGFGDKLPQPVAIKSHKLNYLSERVVDSFSEIINYLKNNSRHFDTVFVSHFAYDDNGRLGIRKLLEDILPK